MVLYYKDKLLTFRTNYAPLELVADFFLFFDERNLIIYILNDNQADMIAAFESTSRYVDDLLNVDN